MSRSEYLTVLILVIPAFVLGWVGGWLWANRGTSTPPRSERDADLLARAPVPTPSGPHRDRDGSPSPADEERGEADERGG